MMNNEMDKLIDTSPLQVLIILVICLVLFLLIYAVISSIRSKKVRGLDSLDSLEGKAISEINPTGHVQVEGEIWKARTSGDKIHKGCPIRVVGKKGLTLVVEKKKENKVQGV